MRRGHRAASAEEFQLPGYALCLPSAETPPLELKRGKRPQSDRLGPKYAKIILEGAACGTLTHRLAMIREIPTRRTCRRGAVLMHMVALGQGISLTSVGIIAMPFPHVVFRPIAGNLDVLPFSGVWLLRNGNQVLRRFISLTRTLTKT